VDLVLPYGLGALRLVNAETGTGKTIVYLAPIVHKLQANMKRISRSDGTFGRYDKSCQCVSDMTGKTLIIIH
jgi:ATP-dependent helicase YprA (DUF1998 family)